MKLRVVMLLLGCTVVPTPGAQPLLLQPSQSVYAGGTPLDPGDHTIPCMADWNGDGLLDLVAGYQPAFKVAVYLNSGSATEPVFGSCENLQAAGMDIFLPSSGCGSPAPWVCDYDGDGKRDLLVGAGADGRVWFYRNISAGANPILASGVDVQTNGATLSVGARAAPYTHDWDQDGLPDLLCGDANGYVHWFRNVGTLQSPVYTNDAPIRAGGVWLNFGARSIVRVCDWDGDGVKDLIGSGAYNAAWCRNTGTDATPVLSSAVRLQAPVSGIGLVNIDTGYRMRLEILDWNGDTLPDLLIGNWDGLVYLYEAYRFVLTDPLLQPGNRCALNWNSAPFLRYNVLAGPAPDRLTPTATNLLSTGRNTCWTNAVSGDLQFFRVQLAQ